MRTFFTALAFLVMLWAVMPAIRRSIYGSSAGDETDVDDQGQNGA
ncbi:MAG: hypothetical protein ETSY2_17130 [Candidatus Entotheonella gemina]|uniref:Uncharacterized protein n=1 Tax=Candidatus Entotheonella gemina TaxID=1429439 RepID=W4M9Y9_9BACT|nr:MAG: hypothetical protein ETSY2_17130 [Candidatus Entotheonella gemina]